MRLKSWSDISTAVKQIWASCKQVIVERFIAGEDIRPFVIQGKMVAAARRIAANVIGDGFSSIESLIEKKNRDPKRGSHKFERLRERIVLDSETVHLIEKIGLSAASVLAKSDRLFLKRSAKVNPQNYSVLSGEN